jgi:hypothetical protein
VIDLKISGRDSFFKLTIDAARMDMAIRKEIRDLAREYNRYIANELRRPKSGITYGARSGRTRYRTTREKITLFGGVQRVVKRRTAMKSKKVKSWTASAPDEPPAIFTGNLLRGLRLAFPKREKGYGARIFSSKKFANHRHWLEMGTKLRKQKTTGRNLGQITPRPLWTPTQRRVIMDLERRVVRALQLTAAF